MTSFATVRLKIGIYGLLMALAGFWVANAFNSCLSAGIGWVLFYGGLAGIGTALWPRRRG